MATVHIPPLMRDLTGGAQTVAVEGATLGRVIDALESRHPGLRDRLVEGDRLHEGIAIAVDGEVTQLDLIQPVGPHSDIHIMPAIAGGRGHDCGRPPSLTGGEASPYN